MINSNSSIKVLKGNIIHGPFTMTQISKLMGQGKLQVNDLISVDGAPWMALAQVWNRQPPQIQHQQQLTQPDPFGDPFRFLETNSTTVASPITDFCSPAQASGDYRRIPSQSSHINQPNAFSLLAIIQPLKIAYISLAILGLICVFLPWWGASSDLYSPGIVAAQVSFNLIGIMFVPWGPMVFLAGVAAIILFFAYPNPFILLSVSAASLLAHIGCSMFMQSLPTFSASAPTPFYDVGVVGYAGFGLKWGYWISLITSILGMSAISAVAFITFQQQKANQNPFQIKPNSV